jgi:hypothetical protein
MGMVILELLRILFHQEDHGSQVVVYSKETGTLVVEWGEARKY